MAESSGEKTEKPTGKKLQDARKEGNVPQSKEVTIAVTLVASFYIFKFLYPSVRDLMLSVIYDVMESVKYTQRISISDMNDYFVRYMVKYAVAALPLLLIIGFAAMIISFAQTKLLINFKSLKPKFSRMNPLEGIKKLFSLKGFIEILKSILKIIVLIYIIYICIKDKLQEIPKLIDFTIVQAAEFTGDVIFEIVGKVVIFFAAIAVADYIYQRFQYQKNLRMTKQEVKEEYKSTEGDPQIKGRIKSKQQEMARRRMLQDVPDADVIIRNPTHFAVALKYDIEKGGAPVVIAKGQDYLALKIIEIAEENEVSIVENVPLARALYATVDIGREIPREFYNSVAEVLAYVYNLKKKDMR